MPKMMILMFDTFFRQYTVSTDEMARAYLLILFPEALRFQGLMTGEHAYKRSVL
jgi:hypothetical protein